jgi:hypothetical protein
MGVSHELSLPADSSGIRNLDDTVRMIESLSSSELQSWCNNHAKSNTSGVIGTENIVIVHPYNNSLFLGKTEMPKFRQEEHRLEKLIKRPRSKLRIRE